MITYLFIGNYDIRIVSEGFYVVQKILEKKYDEIIEFVTDN